MSKAKDRVRAESGKIFRDGKLVSKEEWYKSHPTRAMLVEQRAKVKEAVTAEMASKFPKADEAELAVPQGKIYFCTKCLRYHRKPDSAIYKAHAQYVTSKSQAKRLAIQNVPTM